ncbi:MAG TPA: hypothetical protein VM406_14985 [Noviherbaspirillum sp.]|nr:hypothetical protein [Noviherbaspirillum sp.]
MSPPLMSNVRAMFGAGVPSGELYFLTVLLYCLFVAVAIKHGAALFPGKDDSPWVDRKLRLLWPFTFLAILPAIIIWILFTMFGLKNVANVAFWVMWLLGLAALCYLSLFGKKDKGGASVQTVLSSLGLMCIAMLVSLAATYIFINTMF